MTSAIVTFGFQSTLSVRRATLHEDDIQSIIRNFNPRSPWGERPKPQSKRALDIHQFQSTLSVRRATIFAIRFTKYLFISIHALREESDPTTQYKGGNKFGFQSTLSVRRATGGTLSVYDIPNISIHALREESDLKWQPLTVGESISIHALREESDFLFNKF